MSQRETYSAEFEQQTVGLAQHTGNITEVNTPDPERRRSTLRKRVSTAWTPGLPKTQESPTDPYTPRDHAVEARKRTPASGTGNTKVSSGLVREAHQVHSLLVMPDRQPFPNGCCAASWV
jgi:hypothetical protein